MLKRDVEIEDLNVEVLNVFLYGVCHGKYELLKAESFGRA